MLFEIPLTVAIGIAILIFCVLRKPAKLWKDGYSYSYGSRMLGSLETVYARLGKNGNSNLMAIIFIRSKFLVTEDIVHRALVALSQRHPLLRMRLGKENGQFTYMKEIEEFKVDLEVCQTEDWKGLMDEETTKLYDAETGPLWKVKFIPETSYQDREEDRYSYQSACIFGFHHVITDGQSFLRLFGELVERLHAIRENNEEPVESKPLLPPLDAYIDSAKVYSPLFNLKTNFYRSLNSLTSIPSTLIVLLKILSKPTLFAKTLGVGIERTSNTSKTMGFIPMELTQEQTSQLLACCKRHKTTVQCAIQTAACMAYCSMVNGGKITHANNMNCRISVNLRRFFASHDLSDYFGLYMSMFFMTTTVRPAAPFWNIVSKVTTDLQGALKEYTPFLCYNIFAIFANTHEDADVFNAVNADLPGQRDADLDFHNYGNYNFLNRDEISDCKLSGFFITSHIPDLGFVFGNLLATINGKLSWSILYCSHITTKEQAKEYAEGIMKTLLEALKD